MTATTTDTELPLRIASRLTMTGRVQGIGMRPAVARFAQHLALNGYVGNTHGGVEIHIEGPSQDVERFERELSSNLPVAAEIEAIQSERIEPTGCDAFTVGQASSLPMPCEIPTLSARVPPDVVVCDNCLAEVQNATGRRHLYPFTSCTDCGPRYSIIERMPYERRQTSMVMFPLCDHCRGEYESPADRRFHAQTNACPNCGPQTWLRDVNDRVVARGYDALRAVASAIRDGRTVALRGLGGYQLLVDATSQETMLTSSAISIPNTSRPSGPRSKQAASCAHNTVTHTLLPACWKTVGSIARFSVSRSTEPVTAQTARSRGASFCLTTAAGFERIGHLRPFSLPGGERAVATLTK